MKKNCIESDERLNSELKNDVQSLRGGIFEASEKQKIPKRFKTESLKDTPSIKIIDTLSGRETTVPLFAYKEVKKVLNDLFLE